MKFCKLMLLAVLTLLITPLITGQGAFADDGKKQLELQSGIFGGTLYKISYAYSVVGNKYAKDFEITTVETSGSGAGIVKVYEQPQNRILSATYVTVLSAKKSIPPFKKPYADLRVIGNFTKNIQTFITIDPDIKGIEDLKGKRVGLGPRPTSIGKNMESILSNGYGLKDEVKKYYMTWPQLKDSLLDGSIDAMVLGVTMRPTPQWSPVPIYQEISSANNQVRVLPQSKEAVEKAAVADNLEYPPTILPKDAIGPGVPDQDMPCWSDCLALFVHKDIDDDTAYMLAKILYEHSEEMIKTTPIARGTYKKVIADISLPDDMIHPGALKYYKEQGAR